MSSIPIKSPAPYAVSQAVAYADTDGTALLVSNSTPLPVNLGSAPVPVNGNVSLTGALPAFAATPSVNIATMPEVEIRNDAGNPLPVSGTVTVSNAILAVNVTNAGPLPVARWNQQIHDQGDPLLWIESVPYWETRGYVATVLRNYWMYERQAGGASESRIALVQGMWPTFPGLSGGSAVRVAANGGSGGGGYIGH